MDCFVPYCSGLPKNNFLIVSNYGPKLNDKLQ